MNTDLNLNISLFVKDMTIRIDSQLVPYTAQVIKIPLFYRCNHKLTATVSSPDFRNISD
jgi:hypothetical protein